MNKYSELLFQKSNFSPPGMINFSNIFITSPKTFNLSLGVAGKEILTDRFVTILPIFAAKRLVYFGLSDHDSVFVPHLARSQVLNPTCRTEILEI